VIALLVVLPPEGIWQRIRVQEPGVSEAPPRIVVLPLKNLGSPEGEDIVDGLTSELISRLSMVSGLEVISHTSSMYYKDRTPLIREIEEELDVDYALEGEVRWERPTTGPDRVRISPQLIRVSDDTHIWSEQYDREVGRIFELQSDIAREVVANVRVTLLVPEQRAIEAPPTDSMAAYDAYLRGLGHFHNLGPDWLARSVGMLERAVELDPEFALAHAALSRVHLRAFTSRKDLDRERLVRAKRAADRALELDPKLPEGHLALGEFYYSNDDFDRAVAEIREARDLRPNDAEALAMIATVQERRGKWQEAVDLLQRALELDPKNDRTLLALAGTYAALRRYPEAAEYINRAISIAPGNASHYNMKFLIEQGWHGISGTRRVVEESMEIFPGFAVFLCFVALEEGEYESAVACFDRVPVKVLTTPTIYIAIPGVQCACYMRMGAHDQAREKCHEALEILEKAAAVRPDDPAIRARLGNTYALLGRKEDAIREGERAVELQPVSEDAVRGPTHLGDLAAIYMIVGEFDAALDTIEQFLSIPSEFSVTRLRHSSRWDPLRDHPRFADILEKYAEEE
jgi:serine/threonine-protein kinase